MFVKAEKLVVMNMPVMQFTVYACILGISWLGANMIVGGSLTTGELMSLLTYCMNILMSLMMLSMVFVMITMSAASAERVTEVIKEKADLCDPQNPVMEVADGSIVFDHVDFSYKKDSISPRWMKKPELTACRGGSLVICTDIQKRLFSRKTWKQNFRWRVLLLQESFRQWRRKGLLPENLFQEMPD